MLFESIPGQVLLKKAIKTQIESGKWPHTTILSGPSGVPSLAMALAVARSIITDGMDNDKKVNAEKKINNLIHPDVHYSYPVKGVKVKSDEFIKEWRKLILEDPFTSLAQWEAMMPGTTLANINVTEINSIIRKLSLKAFEGGKKIMIIWGAERLGKDGNRLLKIFEEPPANTYFILTAEHLDQILPTILSRCQLYKLLPLDLEEMAAFLIQRFQLTQERANMISEASEGNLIKAIESVVQSDPEEDIEILTWLRAIASSDFEGILNCSQQINSMTKEHQKLLFSSVLSKLRQSLVTIDRGGVIFADIFKDQNDLDFVDKLSTVLNDIIAGIERNAHVQALITAKSIELWKWYKRRTVLSS
jgi:DNA polymerase-3 subunit delta'